MNTRSWFVRLTVREEAFTFLVAVPPYIFILFESFSLAQDYPGLFWGLVGFGGTGAALIGLAVRLAFSRRIRRLGRDGSVDFAHARRELFNFPVVEALVVLGRWVLLVNLILVVPFSLVGLMTPTLLAYSLGMTLLNGLASALVSYFLSASATVPLRAMDAIQGVEAAPGWLHRDRISTKVTASVALTALYPGGILSLLILLTMRTDGGFVVTVGEVIILTVATVLMVGLIGLLLGRNIKYALHHVRDALEELKQGGGDLTYRAPAVSFDTSGRLATSFNEFLERLAALVTAIQEAGNSLEESGTTLEQRLTSTSDEIDAVTGHARDAGTRISAQDQRLNQVAAAMETISAAMQSFVQLIEDQSSGVQESSAAITEMISSIRSVASNVHKLGTSMQELSEATASGRDKARTMNEQVTEIAEQSETLQEANKLIQGIAAQTNLLAMNAAIEAAHAGEAGRGFSVVAEEIRSLAESAATQSKRIAQQLKGITHTIETVVSSSSDVQGGFERVNSFLEAATQIEAEVRHSMDEQAAGSQQTLNALTHITEITDRIYRQSMEIREQAGSASSDLRTVAGDNAAVVEVIRTMESGIEEINRVIGELTELGQRNKADIAAVVDGVRRFRT